MGKPPKLLPEMVPGTAWGVNLRSRLKPKDWDLVRKYTYQRAGHRCEICGGKGPKHPVECHETWAYFYDESRQLWVQELTGLIALCPACHEVKHAGLAHIKGRTLQVLTHMAKVNRSTLEEAQVLHGHAFFTWHERSKHDWLNDISYIWAMLEALREQQTQT